jgi:hypothetical protein
MRRARLQQGTKDGHPLRPIRPRLRLYRRQPGHAGGLAAIRLDGIGKARQGHDQRKAVVDRLKHGEALFLAAIRPAQSAEEAIEDAARFIACYRNMPRWRQERRGADLARARQQRLLARFFRRYGHRLWSRQAA